MKPIGNHRWMVAGHKIGACKVLENSNLEVFSVFIITDSNLHGHLHEDSISPGNNRLLLRVVSKNCVVRPLLQRANVLDCMFGSLHLNSYEKKKQTSICFWKWAT